MKPLRANGLGRTEIIEILEAKRRGDDDPHATFNDRWMNDRGLLIDDGALEVSRAACERYFTKNNAYPPVMELEADIVATALDLFRGTAEACGNITSGGTESLLLATKAALDWARRSRCVAGESCWTTGKPELVMGSTGYPSFEKFSRLLGYNVVRVPVDEHFRADPRAIRAAVNERTFMLVGSVPPWTHGVCDPIAELGSIALRENLWLHVDACVGGYLAPFVRKLGAPVPDFDLAVPGICSLSADLHKYGYAAKGVSTLFFRSRKLRADQYFRFSDWSAGLYATPTITGTRPGAAIASAWAVMNYLGEAGYLRRTAQILRAKAAVLEVVAADQALVLYGEPELGTITFGAVGLDIFAVHEALARRGWTVNRCKEPEGIQMVFGPLQDRYIGQLAQDLADAVYEVRIRGLRRADDRTIYSHELVDDC